MRRCAINFILFFLGTLIAQREKETEELRKTLSEEKSNKQNKEEYNSIASIVTKLPSRKESEL